MTNNITGDTSAVTDDGEAPATDDRYNSYLEALTGPGLRLWNAVEETDVRFTTSFERPGFKGTAIDNVYLVKKVSDQLGAAGFRWGFHVKSERLDTFGVGEDAKTIHSLILEVWFLQPDGSVRTIEHSGATTAAYWTRARRPGDKPRYVVVEEYLKQSITDSLGKALSLIGVSADVYMGRFDNSKHVRFQQEEARHDGNGAPSLATSDDKLLEHARSVLDDIRTAGTKEDLRAAALRVKGTFNEQPFWPQIVHADKDLAGEIQQLMRAKAKPHGLDLTKV